MRQIKFLEDNFYHLYNRGNSKQPIFLDESDYKRFIKLIYLCNGKNNFNFRDGIVDQKIEAFSFDRGTPSVDVVSWCLMPNHFHIAVYLPLGRDKGKIELDENSISMFMKKLGAAYSQYFNEKYSRTGGLFEGRFKAKWLNSDNYVRYIFSYIHLNPAKLINSKWREQTSKNKNELYDYVSKYPYSSFIDWLNQIRPENKIIYQNSLKKVLPTNFNPEDDLFTWLSYSEYDFPLSRPRGRG